MSMHDDIKNVLVSEEELKAKVRELGAQISRDYEGKNLVLVSILKGSVVFMADLMRAVSIPCSIDFMVVSSYGGSNTSSSGLVKIIKDLDGDLSGKRQVLPGLFYRMPPAQDKHDPFTVSGTGLAAAVSQAEEGQTLDRWLLSQLLGFSPLLCRELSFRATGDAAKPIARMTDENRQQLGKVYDDFMSYVEDNRAKPFLLTKVEDGAVFDFTFLPVTQYEGLMNVTQADSFSALLSLIHISEPTRH